MQFTEDEISRINTALEQTKGHRAAAAKLLGVAPARVYTAVRNNDAMRIRWGLDEPVLPDGPTSDIDRPLPLYSPQDEQVAVAIANQDATLAQGLQKLGYSDDERSFLANLECAYAGHVTQVLQLTFGGLAHSFTRMLFAQRKIEQQIADVDAHPENYERWMSLPGGISNQIKGPFEYRMELVDRLLSISAEIRKCDEAAKKAVLIQAQVAKLKAEAGDGMKRVGKPGFSRGAPPLAVQINAASGSTINMKEAR